VSLRLREILRCEAGCQRRRRRVIPGKVDRMAHHRYNAPRSYAELPLHFPNPSISVTNKSSSATASIIAETPQVIDVDSPGVEERPEAPKTLVTASKGYILIFPDGKSPQTTYPFALDDSSYFRGTTKWGDGAFFDKLHWNNRRKGGILSTMPAA